MVTPGATPVLKIQAENKDCNFVTMKSYKTAKTNKHVSIFNVMEDAGHNGASDVNECSTTQPEINMDDRNRKW